MAHPNDDDRFIGVGEKFVDEPIVDPNQTAIPDADAVPDPTPSDLVDYLDKHFSKTSGPHGGQWRGPNVWVEYGAGQIVIWNARNMRYVHHKPKSIAEAIQWLNENKDVPQVVQEAWRVTDEHQ